MIRVQGGVLFDIDGTLLLGSVGHLVVLGETLGRHLGRNVPIHVEGERPMLDGIDVSGWIDVQVARAVLEAHRGSAVDEAEVADVMAEFERTYTPEAAARVSTPSIVHGAVEALERLHAARIPMGLVTGNASFVARAKLGALGLGRFFRFDRDLGFGDWRTDRPAVAAAGVQALAEAAGGLSHVSYVGDTQRDMEAARAAGVRPIGVLTGTRTADQLMAAGADVVLDSVADLYPPS